MLKFLRNKASEIILPEEEVIELTESADRGIDLAGERRVLEEYP